ncbi:B-cell lymphoma 3 protein homolog isoform X2 [Conger conger]|nr:B-cell lymphoma 3 protein homolog isoform X2 [Conger conger]
MTTSGQQTAAATGPLDLRINGPHGKVSEETGVNPSECGTASCCNGNPMDNGKAKAEEMLVHTHGGPGHSNGTRQTGTEIQRPSRSAAVMPTQERPLKTDLNRENTDCLKMLDPTPPRTLHSVKCERDSSTAAACDSKTMDKPVSRLPFRKRRFPAGQEAYGQSRTPSGSECPRTAKNTQEGGSIPAKLSKRNVQDSVGIRHQVQPLYTNGQGDRGLAMELYQPTPYIPYAGYPGVIFNLPVPVSFPIRPKEEPGYLSIDAATWKDEDGDTALHIAVVQGQEALVHRLIHTLIQAHKDLDIYNYLRQTPLHLAVITNQVILVEALLQGGSDPGVLDRHGQTAVHLCCEHGLTLCLERVLSHPSPLPCLEARNYEGLTPLHLAVQNGNKNLVKLLLNSRADIDAVDIKSGRSPLVHAVENKNIEMVNFLIENRCNVNAQSYSGNTALHSACGRGQVEVVRVLLRNGADSSLKNYHNDTALMVAKNKKVTDVLRGKGSRSQNPKPLDKSCEPSSPHRCTPLSQQLSPNGTPVQSPIHTHHRSPLATHSASHSPSGALPNHCPFTQSTERQSGEIEQQQHLQLLVVHPTMLGDMLFPIRPVAPGCGYQSSMRDCNMRAIIPSFSPYHPQGVPRTNPNAPASLPYPASHSLPFFHGQSRPSSHSSDQSDASTMSISSEGKGES